MAQVAERLARARERLRGVCQQAVDRSNQRLQLDRHRGVEAIAPAFGQLVYLMPRLTQRVERAVAHPGALHRGQCQHGECAQAKQQQADPAEIGEQRRHVGGNHDRQ